jgi:hypothetical protein
MLFHNFACMNAPHTELLPHDFGPDSRVWIYQSPRPFQLSEAQAIESMFEDFVRDWNSHGTLVKGYAHLFYGQFIVLMADETATGISGCSTDSSVRLIKAIEQRFGVPLFDRLLLAFRFKEKIQMVPLSQLPQALDNGYVDKDTLYFNNTVANKAELETKWLIPLKDSWLASKYLSASAR